MKIDIHTHTKKTKSGDPENRNIEVENFSNIVSSTDVKFLAITNHNHFDLGQYNNFREAVADSCQIWPGIELDILEDDRRSHLIVIANPNNAETFNDRISNLVENTTADSFTIGLSDTVKNFDDLDVIYIAHYHVKKPNLSDEDVITLENAVSDKRRVLKEATNSISAGIYISHGHNSIYGSDIQDWNDYPEIARALPELRLPVESYEQFCLLLEKDDTTINTILNKKSKETIDLNPFGVAAETISLDIYNDINIIFGSKGTGKSEILNTLSRFYNNIGYKTNVYASSDVNLSDTYDLKGHRYTCDIADFGIDNCAEEFSTIKSSQEKDVTPISAYYMFFASTETNRISKNIKLKDFSRIDQTAPERQFKDVQSIFDNLKRFSQYIEDNNLLSDLVGAELYAELVSIIERISSIIKSESESRLINYKSIYLFNSIVETFLAEIGKKTGRPVKPMTTGFHLYASNRIKIEKCIKKILRSISQNISPITEEVGDLGEKGKLYCQTNLKIQNGNFSNSRYSAVHGVNKRPQKDVAQQIGIISRHIYQNSLFEKIAELNDVEYSETINNINDLLLFNRHFTLNGEAYTPSNGESSMVMLHNELTEEKDIYILDEPEKSLGNDYISDVIVPILNERAKSGKRIIIATHDANIAVRTLPYNSIYRQHDINRYFTYVGNPFTNNLVCLNTDKEDLDWKEISMKTLEGGRKAFGERGKIYGNS